MESAAGHRRFGRWSFRLPEANTRLIRLLHSGLLDAIDAVAYAADNGRPFHSTIIRP